MSDKRGINAITKPVYDEIMKEVPNVQDVSDIQAMSDSVIDKLKVGDVVAKKTGNQKHCYIVTYKEEKHGICLSYFDGSGYIETISYDYTEGHWVYNGIDVFSSDSIKGFVGDIIVTNATYPYISTDDIPSTNGLYRLILRTTTKDTVVGSVYFKKLSNKCTFFGTYESRNLKGSAVSTTSNIVIKDYYLDYELGTPLYRHNVSDGTNTYTFTCEIPLEITDFARYGDRKFALDNPTIGSSNEFIYAIGYVNSGGNKATLFSIIVSTAGGTPSHLANYRSGIYSALTDTVINL